MHLWIAKMYITFGNRGTQHCHLADSQINSSRSHPTGGIDCLIPVNIATINRLLEQSGEGIERMRYVDVKFEPLAEEAYAAIGISHWKVLGWFFSR